MHKFKVIGQALASILLLVTTLFFIGVWWPQPKIEPAKPSGSLAITNVAIIDVATGEIHPNQTLIIAGNVI